MSPTIRTRKSFSHGIHPPECKEATSNLPIRRFPFAPVLILPLGQHIGTPSAPIVREGQEVIRGEPVAEARGFVSVPLHAPATGRIRKIGLAPGPGGGMVPAIYLEPYPGSPQEVAWAKPVDPDRLTADEIIQGVQDAGLVGLGGAAFPTHVKYKIPAGKKIDTLIINGAECEPYLTTDHRVMLEQQAEIFTGIRLVLKAVGARQAIIGIEANKPDAVASLSAALPTGEPISVEAVRVKYPQGAEKMLIRALLGREVPSGGLPMDVNTVVSNVATIAEVGRLVPRGEGLIERVITITGPGLQKKGNYVIPIGTPLRMVLEHMGFTGDARQVILGGPMMGASIAGVDIPITKGISGILVLTGKELKGRSRPVQPCIRCGYCVDACPIFLNPSRLGLLARSEQYERMATEYNLLDCFECGSCSYSCPSGIPLVHYFRQAKGVLRKKNISPKGPAK